MLSKTWIGDRLRADGVISETQLAQALRVAQTAGTRMEEALLRVGALSELQLLRYLAQMTQTRYLSSRQLARWEVSEEALHKVPVRIAERLGFVPIEYDRRADELFVASADAGVPESVKDFVIATKHRRLVVFLARPAAVAASIRKWYRGEAAAFAELESDFEAEPGTDSGAALHSQVHAVPDRRLFDLAEMLSVLVGLNEGSRLELRGHSNQVARMAGELSALLGFDQVQDLSLRMAANLHDVGKPFEPHLTLLSVNQYQPHRITAQQVVRTPLSWLANVQLPGACTEAVAAMYERFDGRGFPVGLRGGEVPLGARVLSVCDSFHDLTDNPKNPYRRTLTEAEAFEVMTQFQGTLFDPSVVERLAQLLGVPGSTRGQLDAR